MRSVVGEPLLHPVAFVAVGVLLLNDHLLKARYPGWVTGKLSDLAGMVFFPLLLLTLVDIASRLLRSQPCLTFRALMICIASTGVAFASIKTTDVGADVFRWVWAGLQWPARVWVAHRIVPILRVNLVEDATDLVALPMLLVAAWVGRNVTSSAD